MKTIQSPLSEEVIKTLKAGESILLSGVVYTARDAAHKRMAETLDEGGALPFEIQGQTIYYAGPCPAKPGAVIGSCGPTTSGRMDAYAPRLLDLGLRAMIGKGARGEAVAAAIVRNSAVYLGAIGGAGALIAKCVKEASVAAYGDLGAEAVRRLVFENFPLTVLIDCEGDAL
jgi:fumarate hydratase subunit beta